MNCQLKRILDLPISQLHQKATIAIGSPAMVEEMKAFVERYTLPAMFKDNGVA